MALSFAPMFIVLNLISCTKAEPESALFKLWWPSEEGGYTQQDISLPTFDDPYELRGQIAQVIVNPSYSNGDLQGDSVGRFTRNEYGVWIPSDYKTLQATTVYAHVERLRGIDERVGIAGALPVPFQVGVFAEIPDGTGGFITSNALYDSSQDFMLIVPYGLHDVPIGFNGGIIAHEHFHRIFAKTVMTELNRALTGDGPSPGFRASDVRVNSFDLRQLFDASLSEEDLRELYHIVLLRALNEGMADFWAWLYTGDPDFIARSLPSEKSRRTLKSRSDRLVSKDQLFLTVAGIVRLDKPVDFRMGALNAEAYKLGTQFARLLRELTLARLGPPKDPGLSRIEFSLSQRFQGAQAMATALPLLAGTLARKIGTGFAEPNDVLKPLRMGFSESDPEICQILIRVAAPDSRGVKPASCGSDSPIQTTGSLSAYEVAP